MQLGHTAGAVVASQHSTTCQGHRATTAMSCGHDRHHALAAAVQWHTSHRPAWAHLAWRAVWMLLVQQELQRGLLVILGSHLQLQACQLGLVQLHARLCLCLHTRTHSCDERTGSGWGSKEQGWGGKQHTPIECLEVQEKNRGVTLRCSRAQAPTPRLIPETIQDAALHVGMLDLEAQPHGRAERRMCAQAGPPGAAERVAGGRAEAHLHECILPSAQGLHGPQRLPADQVRGQDCCCTARQSTC